MEIIEYDKKYRDEIIDLILDIENNDSKINLSLEEQPDLVDIESYFLKSGGNFWLAVDKCEVVGTIGLLLKENDYCILKKFFVRSEWRSKKIGLLLYETFLDYAKSKNIKFVVLDTPSVAKAAHRFYEKAGFIRVKAEDLKIVYDYPDRDCHLYLLKLE